MTTKCLSYIKNPTQFISAICAIRAMHSDLDVEATMLVYYPAICSLENLKKFKDIIELFSKDFVWIKDVLFLSDTNFSKMSKEEKRFFLSAFLSKTELYEEIYYSTDVAGILYPSLCEIYPKAKRICYGDCFGNFYERQTHLSYVNVLSDKTKENCKPHHAAAILPVDYYGNFLEGIALSIAPREFFVEIVERCMQHTDDLKAYIQNLLSLYQGKEKVLLLTENLAEANFMEFDREVKMLCSIIEDNATDGDVVFLKPHPGEIMNRKEAIAKNLTKQIEIVEIDNAYNCYPVELWKSLLAECTVVCMGYPNISLKYLYDIDVVQSLTDPFIKKWFPETIRSRQQMLAQKYGIVVENLKNWDGESLLLSGVGINEYIENKKRIFKDGIFPHKIKQVLMYDKVIIEGIGSHTLQLLEAYPKLKEKVIAISTPYKTIDTIEDIPVVDELDLLEIDYDIVLISSRSFEEKMFERLFSIGVSPEKMVMLYSEKMNLFCLKNKQKSLLTPMIAFFGHHKAATMWISSIFEAVAHELNLKNALYWDSKLFNFDLKNMLSVHGIEVFSYTNADYKYVQSIVGNIRGFHVVRDPRDICVSSYYSHLYSHPTDVWPELIDHKKKLEKLSKEEGLLLEMAFRKKEFEEMDSWIYENENVLEVKMEDLTSSPYQKFVEIFGFLNILGTTSDKRISLSSLEKIINDNRFSKKSGGRKSGVEDTKSHYRKGIPGDWINHFNSQHIDFFKNKYNGLLLKLGYEKKADWDMAFIEKIRANDKNPCSV